MADLRSTILKAGLQSFREVGYAETTLERVATTVRVDLSDLCKEFPDKESLFAALLEVYSPLAELEAVFASVQGETAENMLRDVMQRLIKVFQDQDALIDLVAIDMQVNNGAFMTRLGERLFPRALGLLEQLKATGDLRPIPDAIIGRALVSMLIGFVASEKAMPRMARMAMRLFRERAWVNGMVDVLLYGILEDHDPEQK